MPHPCGQVIDPCHVRSGEDQNVELMAFFAVDPTDGVRNDRILIDRVGYCGIRDRAVLIARSHDDRVLSALRATKPYQVLAHARDRLRSGAADLHHRALESREREGSAARVVPWLGRGLSDQPELA